MRALKNKVFRISRKKVVKLVVLLGLVLFWLEENRIVDTTLIQYESDEIGKDLDGYTIVQVSDIHNVSYGKNNKKLIDIVKACSPNIIVVTGDLPHPYTKKYNHALIFLEEATKLCPVYYVTGNHEYFLKEEEREKLLSEVKALGVNDLDDASVIIKRGDDSMTLIGIDDCSLIGGTLKKMVESATTSFTVAIAHEPDYLERYAKSGVDLILTGHAHGGQFRIPGIGAFYAPGQGLFPDYSAGMYSMDNTKMVVSRGVGTSLIPLRFMNHPEVVCVKVKRK